MNDEAPAGVRPDRLVVIVGTATEVGKTWVGAEVLRTLRGRGLKVAARKPAQSFAPGDASTDAQVLAAATGEASSEVCAQHRWYEVPMAPPMAAEVLGRPAFSIIDLASELSWPSNPAAVGLVETAGGVRSPLARDGDAVTLIERLQPELVVVVADAGLGTINAVRLTVEALDHGAHGAAITVFLNRFDGADDLHLRNLDWLGRRCGLDVVTTTDDLAARVVGDEARRSRE